MGSNMVLATATAANAAMKRRGGVVWMVSPRFAGLQQKSRNVIPRRSWLLCRRESLNTCSYWLLEFEFDVFSGRFLKTDH